MTRDEEIKEAAVSFCKAEEAPNGFAFIPQSSFIVGALWADSHPRWISVEDELPERDEDVLILTPQNLVHIAAYKYRNWQTKAHVFASGIDGYTWNNVTHWQHLPQPPKKETNKKGGEK